MSLVIRPSTPVRAGHRCHSRDSRLVESRHAAAIIASPGGFWRDAVAAGQASHLFRPVCTKPLQSSADWNPNLNCSLACRAKPLTYLVGPAGLEPATR